MSISKDEASAALSQIEAARGRVWEAKAYSHASPFLILWGVVWLGADLVTQFEPRWYWTWPVGVGLGAVASLVVGYATSRITTPKGQRGAAWRNVALWLVIMGFITGLFLVLPPVGGRVIHSIFGLLSGAVYAAMGLWLGWRLTALGVGLAALTLAGFFLVGSWYAAFMGLVCGGALILGGLWMRKL